MSKGILERASDAIFGSPVPTVRHVRGPSAQQQWNELTVSLTEIVQNMIELKTENAALKAENKVLREQLESMRERK